MQATTYLSPITGGSSALDEYLAAELRSNVAHRLPLVAENLADEVELKYRYQGVQPASRIIRVGSDFLE